MSDMQYFQLINGEMVPNEFPISVPSDLAMLLGSFNKDVVVNLVGDLQTRRGKFNGQVAKALGFREPGDGGGGPDRIWKTGKTPGYYTALHDGVSCIVPDGCDGSAAWLWEYSGPINAKWFGVVDNTGTTDIYSRMQACLTYAQSNGLTVNVDAGKYLSTDRFEITEAMDFICDDNVSWFFNNDTTESSGFLIDMSSASRKFLFKMNFGSLYSPALNGTDVIPGYPGNQVTASRTGNGIDIISANRFDIRAKTMQGWDDMIAVRGTATGNVENFNIEVNTHDWNTNAFVCDTTNGTVNAGYVKFNTMGMAKYQWYFTDGGSGNKISSFHGECSGQVFIKELNACVIYADGNNILNDSHIDLKWVHPGAKDGDLEAPPEVTGLIMLPIIGGSQASNGLTTDGTDSSAPNIGYFTGTRNIINVGGIFGTPGSSATFATGKPVAGDPIRVRLSSASVSRTNQITIGGAFYPISTAPIALTTTLDETTWNGGTGSASIFTRNHVSATLTADLGYKLSEDFYMFHQLSNNIATRPIQILDSDGALALRDLAAYAEWVGGTNRALKISLMNVKPDKTDIASGTIVNFYIDTSF